MKTLNAVDFGDLLLENIRLFREQKEVLRQYQMRFKFILVDEYQDTNVAQYLWLRLLGQSSDPVIPGPPQAEPGIQESEAEFGIEASAARSSGVPGSGLWPAPE